MAETPEVALLGALREAEALLSSRLGEIQQASGTLATVQAELVMAETVRTEATAYNSVLRQQRDTMGTEVARLEALRANLQEETTVLTEMCVGVGGQLELLITEKLAQLKSLRGELAAITTEGA